MGRRGRKRQLKVESRYWQLVLAGVGTVQACRAVYVRRPFTTVSKRYLPVAAHPDEFELSAERNRG